MNIDSKGRVIWTMTTNGYKFYTQNLYTFLPSLTIICCDIQSLNYFRREGIPCFMWKDCVKGGRVQDNVSIFGSDDFKMWNKMKLDILKWICSLSSVKKSIYLDSDIVINKDISKCLWDKVEEELNTSFPLLFQCDCSHTEEHTMENKCKCPCSGVIVHDHERANFTELYTFDKEIWNKVNQQDQPFIQEKLKLLGQPYDTLPRHLYSNGSWEQKGFWKTEPWYLLHFNYRVGNTKKAAMRKAGLWNLNV
jgi:hypothetical protein